MTVKLIVRYCQIKNRYQFIWTHKIKFCKRHSFYCGSLNRGTEINGDGESDKGSRGGTHTRGVWMWLPDRRCLVDQAVAASYHEKNPLPESLQPPCNSPPQGFLESFEGASPAVFRGSYKRGLSADEIHERNLSSCSQNVVSPTTRVATPETPSAGAFKRNRKRRDDERQWGVRNDVKVYPERDGEHPVNDPCAHGEHMVCVQPPCNSPPQGGVPA